MKELYEKYAGAYDSDFEIPEEEGDSGEEDSSHEEEEEEEEESDGMFISSKSEVISLCFGCAVTLKKFLGQRKDHSRPHILSP